MVEPLSPAQQPSRAALSHGGRVRSPPVEVRISHFRLRFFKSDNLRLHQRWDLALSQHQPNKENTQTHRDTSQPDHLGQSSREKRNSLPHRRISHRTLVRSKDRPVNQRDGDPTPITRNHCRQGIPFYPELDRVSHRERTNRVRLLLSSQEPRMRSTARRKTASPCCKPWWPHQLQPVHFPIRDTILDEPWNRSRRRQLRWQHGIR